jgi:NAD(P)-dependent dehydrogenase (short-subunit alcohol dehydrogenase family)
MPPGSAIVNVGSNAAKHPVHVDAAVYASSKAAVLSITRSFAYAFAPHVRVNAVSPGPIDTPGRATVAKGPPEVPLGRLGTPDEVAAVIRFLLSDAAGYMTGQTVNVDGGQITW